MTQYFDKLDKVRYEGTASKNPLAFRHYNPDELILGKRMEDHLRFAACYWHTFCWNGADMFGTGSFNRLAETTATRWSAPRPRPTWRLSFSAS